MVDDNIDNLLVVELLLKETEATVKFVTSGREALTIVQNQNFDLILLDLQMPEMDGFVTLEKLHEQGFTGPVLAISAYALKEDVKRTREAGFTAHVSKPINSKALFDKISQYLC